MRLLPKKKNKKIKVTAKEKLKKATFELLSEKGYASVSTRDIAKRADVAVGQLTYYYKTKDALIMEVVDETIECLILSLRECIDSSDKKIETAEDFFDELIRQDEKTSRILIDVISQALYNNQLILRANELLDKLSEIITSIYISEKNEDENVAKNSAEKFIHCVL